MRGHHICCWCKAEKRLDEIQNEVKELNDVGPKANIKDWEGAKPLTSVKIKKYWVAKLDQILIDGSDEIDIADAMLARTLCEGIEAGEQNIELLLKAHKALKQEV